MALHDFVTKISDVASVAERDFFEVKSDVDLTTKLGRAKVAKFVLGAANRDPEVAARRFDGHALMVLGIEEGKLVGVPNFEAHELQQTIERFAGTPAPSWDFHRVDIGRAGSAVFVIMVAPPDPKLQPWVCCHDGEANLAEGRIYIRRDGNTTAAKHGDVLAMLGRRDQAALPQVALAVEAHGTVGWYRYDEKVVDEYIARIRAKLLAGLPKPKQPIVPPGAQVRFGPQFDALVVQAELAKLAIGMMQPERRSESQYREEIDAWEQRFRAGVPALLDKVVGWRVSAMRFSVTSRVGYLEAPEFDVHVPGAVDSIAHETEEPDVELDLPRPPDIWGPKPPGLSAYGDSIGLYLAQHQHQALRGAVLNSGPQFGMITFRNGGSTTLEFGFGELRPGSTQQTRASGPALVYRGDELPAAIEGEWRCTVRGHTHEYRGTVSLPVASGPLDLTGWLATRLEHLDAAD